VSKNINNDTLEYKELSNFNDWILRIGNRFENINIMSEIEECVDNTIIEIPQDLLLTTTGNKMQALVESTYPDFLNNYNGNTHNA
jgi:hypothetical protein